MGLFVEEAIFAEGQSPKDRVFPDVIRVDILVWRIWFWHPEIPYRPTRFSGVGVFAC